nr:CP43k-like protein 8 isoform 1 [Amphibalanus amphitrite]
MLAVVLLLLVAGGALCAPAPGESYPTVPPTVPPTKPPKKDIAKTNAYTGGGVKTTGDSSSKLKGEVLSVVETEGSQIFNKVDLEVESQRDGGGGGAVTSNTVAKNKCQPDFKKGVSVTGQEGKSGSIGEATTSTFAGGFANTRCNETRTSAQGQTKTGTSDFGQAGSESLNKASSKTVKLPEGISAVSSTKSRIEGESVGNSSTLALGDNSAEGGGTGAKTVSTSGNQGSTDGDGQVKSVQGSAATATLARVAETLGAESSTGTIGAARSAGDKSSITGNAAATGEANEGGDVRANTKSNQETKTDGDGASVTDTKSRAATLRVAFTDDLTGAKKEIGKSAGSSAAESESVGSASAKLDTSSDIGFSLDGGFGTGGTSIEGETRNGTLVGSLRTSFDSKIASVPTRLKKPKWPCEKPSAPPHGWLDDWPITPNPVWPCELPLSPIDPFKPKASKSKDMHGF